MKNNYINELAEQFNQLLLDFGKYIEFVQLLMVILLGAIIKNTSRQLLLNGKEIVIVGKQRIKKIERPFIAEWTSGLSVSQDNEKRASTRLSDIPPSHYPRISNSGLLPCAAGLDPHAHWQPDILHLVSD